MIRISQKAPSQISGRVLNAPQNCIDRNSCSYLETLHTKAFLMNGKLPRNSPLTLFFPKFPFVPPKNIKKPLVYWYFQGDQQGTLGIKSLTETFWKKKKNCRLCACNFILRGLYWRCSPRSSVHPPKLLQSHWNRRQTSLETVLVSCFTLR